RYCPQKKEKSKNSANIIIDDSEDSDVGSALTIFTGNYENEWILDSGASFHISPNKDIFISYKNRDES
ncbi:hypothetical protein S83_036603, partial [Arachis hypogaea]